MKNQFKAGDLVIYKNGDTYQIGKIKRVVADGAFVFYTTGDTASKTPFDRIHKIENSYVIERAALGGNDDSLDWAKAEERLNVCTEAYKSIGPAGILGLGVILAIKTKYDCGVRTQDLFDEIMSLE